MQSDRQERPPRHGLFSSQDMKRSNSVVVAMAVPIERGFSDVWQTSPCRCKLPLPANTDITTSSLSSSIDAKMVLENILPLFHHSNWENPRDSIGDPIGRMRNGRYQCWRVRGPALRIYLEIKAQLRECINAAQMSETVTWGMYMVGHRERDAAPKILICSTEGKIRKDIRRRVRDSQLLDRYPGVGLGDTSILPDRVEPTETAKEEIDKILPPDCDIKTDRVVLIKGMEASPGKWIYTVNSDGGSLRAAATSGPFVFINDTWCQLTVSHPFVPSEPWTTDSSGAQATIEDDCDFEGMSDVDEEADQEATACASVSSFSIKEESFVDMRSPAETDTQDSYIGDDETSDAETSNTISDSRPSTPSNSRPTTISESFDGAEDNGPQSLPVHAHNEDLNMSRLQYLGKLGLASDEFKESSQFDYALIVINDGQIPQLTTPQYINPQLVIAKSLAVIDLDEETCAWRQSVRTICPETIDENLDENFDRNLDVVTLMPRAGPVSATLIPNPTFLRIAGKSKFQEVYPLTLKDATVSKGDSGSPVFDSTGKFCGHIVAAGEGTPHAYMIPAVDIMRDLEGHVWGKINLPTQSSMRVAKPIGTLDYVSTHTRLTTSSQEPMRPGAAQRPDVKYKDGGTNPELPEPHQELPNRDITGSSPPEKELGELTRSWNWKSAVGPVVLIDCPGISEDCFSNNLVSSPEVVSSESSATIVSLETIAAARPDEEGGYGRFTSSSAGSKLNSSTLGQPMASKPHILPPPHLRPKVSPTPDPIHPGALTTGLSESTLRLMKSWAPSMPGESLFPTGLTVVSADEELCDSLVERRPDSDFIKTTHILPSKVDDNFKTSQRTGHLAKEWRSLVMRSSSRRDALKKEQYQKEATQGPEPGRETQHHHHHHTAGVRDKFRSMTTKIGGAHTGTGRDKKEKANRHVGHSSKTDLRRHSSWGSSHSVNRYLNSDLGLMG